MIRPRPSLASVALAVALVSGAAGCRTAASATPPLTPPLGAAAAAPPPANVYQLVAPEAQVQVSFPAEGTVRVRLSPDGRYAPVSFAVEPELASASLPYRVEEGEGQVVLRAAGATVRLTRSPLRIALLDAQGRVVAEEAAPITWSKPGFTLAWTLAADEHVYGLGDRGAVLDRRGRKVELWNADAMGAYRSFPVMLFLAAGRSHGLFVDSPARGEADLGGSRADLVTYRARAGTAVDLYLFAGPGPKDVLARYTALTGRMPLPPRWALGYHQCRYSYMSEAELREVEGGFRTRRIPLDAVWLDIDYQLAYRPFTVDPRRFPDMARMTAELRRGGTRTVVIVDPHVAELPNAGYAPFDTGLKGDHFVRDGKGAIFTGDVWPSHGQPPARSVFPDFASARARAWWGGLFSGFLDMGVAGIWNDMNEPAIFSGVMPGGTLHHLDDGTRLEHREIHNAYGLLNARATFEGLARLRPQERPFVLTRSAFAGAQRFAATWTGDNAADRADLEATIPMILNLGLSGFPFAGADVGGFQGCPEPDLLTEWMELGAYQPFYRNHSGKDTCRREPWVNGPEQEARRKAAIERRYRLLPYLYTAFEEASRTGVPVMRPLWLEYPTDTATYGEERAYLLGRDLVVAPKLEPGAKPYTVTLPAADFWDVRSGERVTGGATTLTPAPDDSVRVLVRAGAIVPQQPVVQHTGEAPDGPLTVHVWPGKDCAGALYLDDGASVAYRAGDAGASRRVVYACQATNGGIDVAATSTGGYPTWWRATEVVVHGVPRAPREVKATGFAGAPRHDAAARTLTVTIPGGGADWTVTARW
jgi:alpha-glucosidase